MSQSILDIEGSEILEQKESGNKQLGKTREVFANKASIILTDEIKAKFISLRIPEDDWDIGIKLLGITKNNSIESFSKLPFRIKDLKNLFNKFPQHKKIIIEGLESTGEDIFNILGYGSGREFITKILENFPERFVEFCKNLKKLTSILGDSNKFYDNNLSNITKFIIKHPNNWNILLDIGKIFGKFSFNIFGGGMPFVYKVAEKYTDNNCEEFFQKILELGRGFKNGNDTAFFSGGLGFSSQFLDESEEKFFQYGKILQDITNKHIKDWNSKFFGLILNQNTSGLDFISKYLNYYPENFEKITEKVAKLIEKHLPSEEVAFDSINSWDNYFIGMNQLVNFTIFDIDPSILDELLNFYNKIGNRKDDIQTISRLKETYSHWPLKKLTETRESEDAVVFSIVYLLKYKKGKIIDFAKKINLVKDLGLDIDYPKIFLGGKPLEYLEESELQELFTGESVEQTKIYKNFKKLGGESHIKANEVKLQIQSLLVKNGKKFDKTKVLPTLIKLQNVFADLILANFETILKRKIHIKFKTEFKVKEFDDSLINENLLEFYKMYKATKTNKKEAYKLINNYLEGKSYDGSGDILKKYPYSRRENKEFLKETLSEKGQIWLSKNEQEFDVDNIKHKDIDNNEIMIAHHLKVAKEKLEILEIKENFDNPGKLINFFETKLKKVEEKYDKNIFDDLAFQVESIKKLFTSSKSRKISKIKIYHELNPIKKAMMGNWVDGSCLSFYNEVGNYWSAITNALEVNKGVFYIEDEMGNIIARVLVCLDNEGKLDIHPMYFKGNIEVDLQKFFDKYIKELALQLGILNGVNGYRYDDGVRSGVKLLFCEDWYNGD
ncbi:MAG: hypothetical protein WC850_04005 [Candidatus Gracilibacteria bacterium]